MKRFLAAAAAILLCISALGCTPDVPRDDGRLKIVSVTFPTYDFARAICGELASVTMLLDPGMETHSYDPSPGDVRTNASCDVFLYGGGASDTWMKDILASVDTSRMTILAMTELVEPLREETKEGMAHGHDEEHDAAHPSDAAYDEHVWTSPENAVQIAEAICRAVCEADPENAGIYRANADGYLAQIRALHEEFAALAENASRKTVIFADRFPFLYLTQAYGLEYFAAFPGCAEKTEPGPQTIAFLTEKVKSENIPAVFYTEFSNQELADAICEATGAKKLLLHSCHNVSKTDFEAGVTYVSLMRKNLENLRRALSDGTDPM